MIHGDGVGAKYDIIITGRSLELELEAPANTPKVTIDDQVLTFVDHVRNLSHVDFNELYELYFTLLSDFKLLPTKKRKRHA